MREVIGEHTIYLNPLGCNSNILDFTFYPSAPQPPLFVTDTEECTSEISLDNPLIRGLSDASQFVPSYQLVRISR
jgi:hypothetical protein